MTTKHSHQLKHLQTERNRLTDCRHELFQQNDRQQAELDRINNELRHIEFEITKLQSHRDPVVSEHALLRYIERRLGLNLDDVRAEILQGRTEQIRKFKTCKIKTDGMTLVVKNQVVVTVID
jgi:predicted nuclease with TOPRIM domain